MQNYNIMTRTDFDVALLGAIKKIADGENIMGNVIHSAMRACLFRKELDQVNAISQKCSELALFPVISKAIKILSGGYYETKEGERFFKEESSLLRFDAKNKVWEFVEEKSDRLQKVQISYAYWHNTPLRGITAKTPEAPLGLEPIRKYIAKLQKSGSKWLDTEREQIKMFLNLTSGLFGAPLLTDGVNHCASQTANLDGSKREPKTKK